MNRRGALAAIGTGLSSLAMGDLSKAIAQSSRNYFSFDLASKHPTAIGIDRTFSPALYRASAAYLDAKFATNSGVLTYEDKTYRHEERIGSREETKAIDFARAVARNTWRVRFSERRDVDAKPTPDELERAVNLTLETKGRNAPVPMMMSVYACDNERGGASFGTPKEIEALNKISRYHGLAELKGPIREQGRFLELVRTTAPGRTKSGDLIFGCGFNGHGAAGGAGMSMLSSGASNLSRALMTGMSIGKALEEHCQQHRDVYMKQAKSDKSAYIGVFIFCCYSQDQVRNNSQDGRPLNGNDLLSRMETLTAEYKVRFHVLTESEAMKPGYYQPGTVIPSLLPRALARAIDRKAGNLQIGDTYKDICAGGEGVGSNPTLFATARRKPIMLQIG